MRFPKKDVKPCAGCKQKKGLDMKLLSGGSRYMDQYAVECVWCGIRAKYEYSIAEAIAAWNLFVRAEERTEEL